MNKIIRLQIIKSINIDWKIFKKILKDIQSDTYKIMNKSTQCAWEWNNFSSDYIYRYDLKPKIKDVLNYSNLQGYSYDNLKSKFIKPNTKNLSQTIKRAIDKFNNDKNDIIKGDRSIANFKNNCPIDIVKDNIKIIKKDSNYILKLSLISELYKKELDLSSGQFEIIIKVPDNARKVILDRILSGEYKVSASQIINKKNKWFINLCYGFEAKKKELDTNNIMGIDMGIIYPVYVAFNNSLNRAKIEGGEIDSFRKQTEKRKNELYSQSKFCGEGRIGHGVKTRIKPIEFAKDKIANFRNTTNHKYSKYIIDLAIKNNCGIIQMEDLSGIATDNKFLKNWSYYDLQQKIQYKAEEKGIIVKKINPEYTSQRCSKCGYIHKDNRPKGEKGQSYFKCVECGFEVNADYNAARNIATQDIEYIIKDQLTKQNKEILIKIS